MKGVEYKGVNAVDGPIIIVRRSENVFYGEIVDDARNWVERVGSFGFWVYTSR